MSYRHEIAFRGSLEQDGIPSRGSHWHARESRHPSEEVARRKLSRELAEGDLVREGRDPLTLSNYLRDHGELRLLFPCRDETDPRYRPRGGVHASRFGNDWDALWRSVDHAEWLIEVAAVYELDLRLRVEVSGACAETALRHLPAGEGKPAKALRLARWWARGAATREEAEEAARAADNVASELFPDFAWAAMAAAVLYRPVGAVRLVVRGGRGATEEGINRSLAFLIRALLPSWRLCALLVRRPRKAGGRA